MIFETKYNIEDSVWVLINNKVRKFTISSIDVKQSGKSLEVRYYLNIGTKEDYKCHIVEEDKCFTTKEELIKSLD